MSSEPLARPDNAAEAPISMDYEAVYAAVTAMERGPWSLAGRWLVLGGRRQAHWETLQSSCVYQLWMIRVRGLSRIEHGTELA